MHKIVRGEVIVQPGVILLAKLCNNNLKIYPHRAVKIHLRYCHPHVMAERPVRMNSLTIRVSQ
jgi:hypothetical protein